LLFPWALPDEPLVDTGAVPAEQVRFQHPLSNRACPFRAHGLPTIFIVWRARGSKQSVSMLPAGRHPCRLKSYNAWKRRVLFRLAHTYSLRWSSRALLSRVVGSCDHALALTSSTSVIEAEPLPSSVFPRLRRYYEPLGLPPDSEAISAFRLIRSVFARRRLPGRVSPVPSQPLETCRRPYPGEIQHPLRIYPSAVYCLHHDTSGSALPITFRLII
jgi:hypothetical protein